MPASFYFLLNASTTNNQRCHHGRLSHTQTKSIASNGCHNSGCHHALMMVVIQRTTQSALALPHLMTAFQMTQYSVTACTPPELRNCPRTGHINKQDYVLTETWHWRVQFYHCNTNTPLNLAQPGRSAEVKTVKMKATMTPDNSRHE